MELQQVQSRRPVAEKPAEATTAPRNNNFIEFRVCGCKNWKSLLFILAQLELLCSYNSLALLLLSILIFDVFSILCYAVMFCFVLFC